MALSVTTSSGPYATDGWFVRFNVDGRSETSLSLAFQGRLEEVMEAERERVGFALTRALNSLVPTYKKRLRATIEGSGFYKAGSLAKTWRVIGYPKGGDSLEPALFIATKAGTIIEAFEEGVTITPNGAKFLAIPTGPARAVVRKFNTAVRFSPRNSGLGRDIKGQYTGLDGMVQRVAAYLGVKIVPIIDPKTGHGVLVADDARRLTKTGRNAKRQGGAATVLFILVKQAKLPQRPMGLAVLNEIEVGFYADLSAAFERELQANA